jgi:hypothetical protein
LQQINDLNVAAGIYGVSSVGHGFLAYSTHFMSFDFPDSVATGLGAVNDLGEVGGNFVAVPGGPVQAFIAIQMARESAGDSPESRHNSPPEE